jgi:hypothetical protein
MVFSSGARWLRCQPRQILGKNLSRKYPTQKSVGGMAQGVGPEFKPQNHKKRIVFSKTYDRSRAPLAHTYNPSYSGSTDQEDEGSKPAPSKYFRRPYLKKNQHKTGLTEWLKW